MPARSAGGDALSRGLRQLRDAAGLRQVDAAAQAGVSQALIARFETGRQVPRPDQVGKLCDVYLASDTGRARVMGMAQDARASTKRVVMHRETAPAQREINRIADASEQERTFTPSGLPGLLQTADYCRVLFRADPNVPTEAVEAGAEARMEGQALLGSGREFGFLIPEGSLGWALLDPAGMAAQIEHLARYIDRPKIRLGIIPWGHSATVLPLNSFTIFDQRLAIVGTTTRVAYLTARTDLDAYERLYEQLADLAVYGEQARAVLTGVADRYRTL